LRILAVLRHLLELEQIDIKEYDRAKKYYKELTGADIFVAE
jgi:hypothetical protein